MVGRPTSPWHALSRGGRLVEPAGVLRQDRLTHAVTTLRAWLVPQPTPGNPGVHHEETPAGVLDLDRLEVQPTRDLPEVFVIHVGDMPLLAERCAPPSR